MKKKENAIREKMKKGAISIDFVIGVILLVLGFAIVLVFYFNIGGTGRLDRTLCHESVLLRASLPTLVEDYVPLKCKTNKVCLTSGLLTDTLKSRECKDFAGEKSITTIKVKSVSDIEKAYAQEILECWSMMGEGKANLYNQYFAKTFGLGRVYPTCIICSRIAFNSQTITPDKFDLSRMDVARYMMTHKIPGKNISYLEYIASEQGKVAVKEELMKNAPNLVPQSAGEGQIQDVIVGEGTGEKLTETSVTPALLAEQAKNLNLQLDESAVLFMQISAPEQGQSLKNLVSLIGGGLAVSRFVVAPTLTTKAITSAGGLCTKGGWVGPVVCGVLAIAGVGGQQINVAYNRAVTAGYCGDVSIGTEARSGCSVVRTVNYSVSDMSQYCSVIESIP